MNQRHAIFGAAYGTTCNETAREDTFVNPVFKLKFLDLTLSRSQWPRCLRCRSTAALLLRLWVRIPPGTWVFVCCECCVLSGRSLRRIDHSSRGVLPTVARRCV